MEIYPLGCVFKWSRSGNREPGKKHFVEGHIDGWRIENYKHKESNEVEYWGQKGLIKQGGMWEYGEVKG